VTRNKDVMRDIFEGLKADAAFGNKFKDMEWNKIWKLIKKDPMLDGLAAADKGQYAGLAKALEGKAMTRFKALDTEAGAALERIKGAADDVLAFGAKDKRVAGILNKIFGRDLYVSDKVAAEAAAARAKAAGAKAPDSVAIAADMEIRIGKDLVEKYKTQYAEAQKFPSNEKFILESAEKDLIKAFREKYAAEKGMTAERLAEGMKREFDGLKFRDGAEFGDFKLGNKNLKLKADDDGIMRLFEDGKADYVGSATPATTATTTPAAVPGAAPAATVTAPAAAVEISRAGAVVGYMKGKIGGAKELYTKFKGNLPPSIKDQIYKLLSDNAAILTYMPTLEKLHPQKPIDERIAEIEDRIAQIEATGELPPDVVFPDEIEEMIKRGKDVQ